MAPYQAKDFSHLYGMPGFSKELLTMHFTLYKGYVKNANFLLDELDQIDENSYEYGALKRRLGWEFDGMRLHEYYFGNLGGTGRLPKKSELYRAIENQFGSYAAWRRSFIATGMIRGIGWVILYRDPEDGRLVNVWINEHDTGHFVAGNPILVMDVWEHAYITQFGLNRKKYIETFFDNIDWNVSSGRYSDALDGRSTFSH